ncbi:hypothetical protein TTE2038 [Caldanaerobacter subterraneus subsp. tengcongensis MB4]|uniref:DUF2281 domain-containing protein n=2 Tax=Caldanaerobacter subterraneus TaxID=911092 RepID=Q8R8G1_CALS4|nr:hypothetical protein TTE2038 [Caldanaerobacter subterraneus subsp. tengcongensis MB4]
MVVIEMSKALNDRLDDIIYEKVKMMPKDEQKEVLDFVEYLIQKRLKIVKDMFEITKETKRVLESHGYSEDNISELVKEIRETND